MTDAIYVRGWDDCLEAISAMIAKSQDVGEVRGKIEQLRGLVRQNKFEKIRYELGAFGLF